MHIFQLFLEIYPAFTKSMLDMEVNFISLYILYGSV